MFLQLFLTLLFFDASFFFLTAQFSLASFFGFTLLFSSFGFLKLTFALKNALFFLFLLLLFAVESFLDDVRILKQIGLTI